MYLHRILLGSFLFTAFANSTIADVAIVLDERPGKGVCPAPAGYRPAAHTRVLMLLESAQEYRVKELSNRYRYT